MDGNTTRAPAGAATRPGSRCSDCPWRYVVPISGSTSEPVEHGVGPVLARGALCDAVLRALEELNRGIVCVDRGAYVRVYVPFRCVLERTAVERHSGQSFRLPGDLESIM